MKQFILFVVIFGLGALSFALFDTHFAAQKEKINDTSITATTTASDATQQKTAEETEGVEIEDSVIITPDGSLLDGPFPLFSADGTQTSATVRLIRSPEERLMQFENFSLQYSPASHVYFASDKEATEYLSLGPAKMSQDYLVYGIPLDADLSPYKYILIYHTQLDAAEYYARIQ